MTLHLRHHFKNCANCLLALLFLLAAAGAFLRPQAAMAGALQGMATCAHAVIPTLFPFLVLSGLILSGPLAQWAGFALRPFTKLLGIRSKKAPAALLCGLLGGFAPGARAVGQLRRQNELSAAEAECLLVGAVCSGPAFVVGSVGTAMLGSRSSGWILYLCQAGAGLLCALIFRPKPPVCLTRSSAGWRRRLPTAYTPLHCCADILCCSPFWLQWQHPLMRRRRRSMQCFWGWK